MKNSQPPEGWESWTLKTYGQHPLFVDLYEEIRPVKSELDMACLKHYRTISMLIYPRAHELWDKDFEAGRLKVLTAPGGVVAIYPKKIIVYAYKDIRKSGYDRIVELLKGY